MSLLLTHHSIIAVPGLGTKAEMTFRSRLDDGTVCNDIWLRDYLPHYIKRARVLLYGYNSQVPNSNSAANYSDMASTLLRKLCLIREETKVGSLSVLSLGFSSSDIISPVRVQSFSSATVWAES